MASKPEEPVEGAEVARTPPTQERSDKTEDATNKSNKKSKSQEIIEKSFKSLRSTKSTKGEEGENAGKSTKSQRVVEAAKGTGTAARQLMALTIVGRVISLLINIIPIFMVVVGALKWNDCPLNSMIPIWLVVGGTLYLLSTLLDIAVCFKSHQDRPQIVNILDFVLTIVAFGWLIAGSVFVYSAFGKMSDDTKAKNYCHPLAYWTAFATITAAYGIVALFLIVLVLLSCFIAFCPSG